MRSDARQGVDVLRVELDGAQVTALLAEVRAIEAIVHKAQ